MRYFSVFLLACLTSAFIASVSAQTPSVDASVSPLDRANLPGRQVKVAAVCIGFGGQHDAKLKEAVKLLHVAGRNGVDIACLPEEFAGTQAEAVPGPTTEAVAELARKYHMYVICPLREWAGQKEYNTAVLIDREGQVAGRYRKVFVFWGEGVHCSVDGVKSFETDFGKIGMLTCFDLNFPELWQRCDQEDVDIVFWPSAYGGGSPLNAMAILYHYYIVPVGAGNIVDITGNTVKEIEQPRDKLFIATLDLDRTFVHYDFNRERVEKMLAEHKGELIVERNLSDEDLAPWWLFRSIKPSVRVRDVMRQYQIESLREYQQRSRRHINQARKNGKSI